MVSVVDLDQTDEALLGIALNKVRGEWDREKLVELLQEIQDTQVDVTLTGFDGVDFDDALLWPEDDPAEDQDADDADEGWIVCPNFGHEFKEQPA